MARKRRQLLKEWISSAKTHIKYAEEYVARCRLLFAKYKMEDYVKACDIIGQHLIIVEMSLDEVNNNV